MIRPPTISPLFPYTTLFRSKGGFVELDQRTLGVLLEMTHARGPRDREHHGGPPQQPGERHLSWRSPEPTGHAGEPAAAFREPPHRQRIPRQKAYPRALAVHEHVLELAVDQTEPVLHG